jgi:ABC-type glucose/galactose transport system permease subunit
MYGGSESRALPFFTSILDRSDWSASPHGHLTLGQKTLGTIRYEALWALKTVWTMWRREKFLASVGNKTSAAQPVAGCYAD